MARMNVLLTQDVDTLGEAGEIHKVASGYARNYLMPQGMAILATKGALKQAEEIKQAGIRRRAQLRANAEAQAQVIEGRKLLFTANAGENDRLYGSVTTAEIAEQLEEIAGFDVDRRRIQLHQPLRSLGIFELELRFMAEVSANFLVAVVREGENWDSAVARAEARAAEAEAEAQAQAEADALAAAEAEADATDEDVSDEETADE